jgi:hypothetical protein
MYNDKEIALEIRRILSCPAEQRASSIIDSPNCEEILQQIPVQDAYMIIKDSFGGDSQFLLPYVKPERVVTFIDIDCWKGDRPSAEGIFEWLSELVNAADDTLMDTLNILDTELIILLFNPYLKVTVMSPTDDNIPNLIEAGFETFDNNYFFTFSEETEETKLLRFILDRTFLYNQDMYFRILEGVRWELTANMEETAFHHRSIRLTELGFPPPEEASGIYSRRPTSNIISSGLRTDQIPIIREEEKFFLPALYNEQISGSSLLSSAIAEADSSTVENFTFEMMYLANKVIMADYRPLNDTGSLRISAEKAAALTSLGLSIAMRKKRDSAPDEILKSMTAETLFSLGFNTLVELQDRLRRSLKGIGQGMVPASCREITESLLKKYPVAIADRFITIDDIDRANEVIERIELMHEMINDIGFKGAHLEGTNIASEGLDMENIILTMVAINVVSGGNLFRPLSQVEFMEFINVATGIREKERRVKQVFINELKKLISGMVPESGRQAVAGTVEQLSMRLDSELVGFKSVNEINPQYITCLVVKL